MQLGKSDSRSRIEADSTERAVSPVIGVILMVAITVVLAGVIGVMVFGLADDLGDAGPTTTADIVHLGDEDFEFQHGGGDSIAEEELIANAYDEDGAQLDSTGVTVDNDEFAPGSPATGSFDDAVTGIPGEIDSVELIHEPTGTTIGTWDA